MSFEDLKCKETTQKMKSFRGCSPKSKNGISLSQSALYLFFREKHVPPMRGGGARANRSAPREMTAARFMLALWTWLVLAAAATAQLDGGVAPSAPAPAMETSASASRPPSVDVGGGVPPRPPPPPPTTTPKPPSTSKRALDPKKRPNDVYAPTNGSFDFYKLQVYWPSSIFKPQQ